MDENRFWILASKNIAADISPEELAELDLLFIQHPEYKALIALLEPGTGEKSMLSPEEEGKVLRNLRSKLAGLDAGNHIPKEKDSRDPVDSDETAIQRPAKLTKALVGLIAGITCVVVAILFFSHTVPNRSGFENNIATRPGSRSQVKLPDGTLVTLNGDSKLTYPDNFVGNTREVTLEGEAFFEVSENKLRPFIIHSKLMDIKVLGTVFNVKAYPSENVSEASLIRGSIEVTLKERRNQKIMLKPNEKISVSYRPQDDEIMSSNAAKQAITRPNHNEPLISVDQLSIDRKEHVIREIGWTQNKLMFQNESLSAIAVILQRWYGQPVLIRSEILKGKMFTGNFQNENLGQVLGALQAAYNFNIRNENNTWVIYDR